MWTVLQKWISLLPEDKAPKALLQELERLMKELGNAGGWSSEGVRTSLHSIRLET
jgi:hypothetical protein